MDQILFERNSDGSFNVLRVQRIATNMPAHALTQFSTQATNQATNAFGGVGGAGKVPAAAAAAPVEAFGDLPTAEQTLIGAGAPIPGTPFSTTDPRLAWVCVSKARFPTQSQARDYVIAQLARTAAGGALKPAPTVKAVRVVSDDWADFAEDNWCWKVNDPSLFDTESFRFVRINDHAGIVVGARLSKRYASLPSPESLGVGEEAAAL